MKFNEKNVGSGKTVNYEGEVAYKLTPELELYSAAVTSSLSDKFYEASDDRVERIRGLVRKCDPKFVAKLAVYTREQMYLRSMPLVLVCELAKVHSGDDLVRSVSRRVIQRADEITEILAYYAQANNRTDTKKLNKLSTQLRKRIADAFNQFTEYQFAKYNRSAAVTLRDALFLTHPNPKTDEQQAIFDKIVSGALDVPYTWETQLSELGKATYASDADKQAAFKAKWEELIESRKVGYMALIRNLRNMLQAGVSVGHMSMVCEHLSDPVAVQNAKQFPFRFYSAYKMIEEEPYVSEVVAALEKAIQLSVANIKGFAEETRVVIACDTSGSMDSPVSERSAIRQHDVGLLLGMLLQHKCKHVMTGIFGERWKVVSLPKTNILSNASHLDQLSGAVGHATNGYLVLEDLIKRKIVADKICVFTDCQLWNTETRGMYGDVGSNISDLWVQYKKEINPEAKIYMFDLSGYGNTPISVLGCGVYLIAGWSDKVFTMLDAIENGSNAVKVIDSLEI
jgi:60 kDa SS-A/Ro ribonucleoprotein